MEHVGKFVMDSLERLCTVYFVIPDISFVTKSFCILIVPWGLKFEIYYCCVN